MTSRRTTRLAAAFAVAVVLGVGTGSAALAGGPSPAAGPDRPATAVWQEGEETVCRAATADLDGGCSLNRLH